MKDRKLSSDEQLDLMTLLRWAGAVDKQSHCVTVDLQCIGRERTGPDNPLQDHIGTHPEILHCIS